jgi:23S rRNA pseudouridine1911/1915/1917 synthase
VSDRIETLRFTETESERLDKFLTAQLTEFSRARLQGLIADGFVLVDGTPAAKGGLRLEGGERIEVHIPPPQPTGLQPESIPLEVLFENQDLLLLNKPAGMVVHPAAGHDSGTLVHAVLGYAPDIEGIGGEERPGIVHRLDKDTSGLILVAKNDQAMRWLQEQFRQRLVQKTYLALVDGIPPTPTGRIEAPIGRDPHNRKKMAIVHPPKGREAISEYKTLQNFPHHTLLEFYPHTGRTHQVRLHCAFLGCPIVADSLYGHRKASLPLARHFLHAWKMEITLPGEKTPVTFTAPLDPALEETLAQLRRA